MKNIYIVYLLLIVLFSSCEDFLDQQPKTQVDAEHMFQTEQGFKDALTECYLKMANDRLYGLRLSISSIELMAQHWQLSNTSTELELKELDFSKSYARDLFMDIYEAQYNVIVQANDVLSYLGKYGDIIESEQLRGIIEAEALAVRAFIHADLLRMFGQMPQNASKKVSLAYAQTVGKEEIPFYDFDTYVEKLMADLDRAEELFALYDPLVGKTMAASDAADFSEEYFLTYRRYRFNLYAVQALKARLYLYLGRTADAYQYASNLINAKTTNGESVLTLTGNSEFVQKHYSLPMESICLLAKTDLNNSMFTNSGYRINQSDYAAMFEGQSGIDYRSTMVWQLDAASSWNRVYLFKKYEQPEIIGTIPTETILKRQVVPLLRLAEMFLIAIETAPNLSDANDYYRTFMASRGVIVSQDFSAEELKTKIEQEYHREFYGEGQMFYYYKRHATPRMWGQSITSRDLTEDNYVVPLPSTELN